MVYTSHSHLFRRSIRWCPLYNRLDQAIQHPRIRALKPYSRTVFSVPVKHTNPNANDFSSALRLDYYPLQKFFHLTENRIFLRFDRIAVRCNTGNQTSFLYGNCSGLKYRISHPGTRQTGFHSPVEHSGKYRILPLSKRSDPDFSA